MLKSVLYLQHFGGLLINRPADPLLNRFGLMHEGPQASFLGMKGMPALAETLMIKRDLDFLEYCGVGRLHFSCLSSAQSVALVRQAKAQGWEVSCDVAAHQLAFNDSALQDFDTHFKLNPPLRSEEDRLALWEGLADGTIDAVVSDHCPQDIESKRLEFDLAEFGAIGLETVFSAINTYNKQVLTLEQIIDKIALAPRRLLGLPLPELKEGAEANLTIFDTDSTFLYDKASIVSASHNSPFLGQKLQGRARGIVQGIYTEFFD
jgi:dihydroorotase